MQIIEWISFVIWAGGALLMTYGTWRTLRYLSTPRPKGDVPFGLYPVSILKPVKGASPGLSENFESFFRLDYSRFELIFSIADADDPARRVIEELIKSHPKVQARLIIGDLEVGLNPKVNNMVRGYRQAKYDLILVSDSDVRVEPSYLTQLVAHLDSGAGVITALVVGGSGGSEMVGRGSGLLESMHLNTFYARCAVLSIVFRVPYVIGKSMLFRRSIADRFGGLEALAKYLAEDYMLGVNLKKMGYDVLLAGTITQPVGRSVIEAWRRQIRWGLIRKMHNPGRFILEFAMGAVGTGILGAYAISRATGVDPILIFFLHLSSWCVADLVILNRLDPNWTYRHVFAWVAREILFLPLWFRVLFGRKVDWCGKKFRLKCGGVLAPG